MERDEFLHLCQRRATRAFHLSQRYPASREVLLFYKSLVSFQERICFQIQDLESLSDFRLPLVELVYHKGPGVLQELSQHLSEEVFRGAVQKYWEREDTCSPISFFARAVLQPYAAVATVQVSLGDENHCSRCGHLPQVGVLRPQGNGNAFNLVCSLCLHEWSFSRGLCVACGEDSITKLAYYSTCGFDYIQIQACESCRTYLSIVNLEKDPTAVPEADELTALPLDVWSKQQGYQKQQPNLGGI
jgi:FdhE protein